MKAEYTADDFAKGVKNPYFDKLARKKEVAVTHNVYQLFCDIGKQNGVEPEVIMNRCLVNYAKRLIEDDEELTEKYKNMNIF